MKQIALFILFLCLPAVAIARNVALVIGNSTYEYVAELSNPQNDSAAISSALTAQGFEVISGNNLNRVEMRKTLRKFRDMADSADIALVYYAGHGIEIAGQNYLMPVDASLEDERDAGLEMIDVDLVLRQISGAKMLKMVVLDACRNNPFITKMKRENAGRNVGRGLAIVDSAEADTLIAYAAAAGEVTPDGDSGGNSPFTAAFLKALSGPPSDVRRMLGAVRDQMRQTVPGAAPFIYSSLGGGEYVINPESKQAEPDPVETVMPAPNLISQDFVTTDQSRSVANWDAFLVKYEAQNQHPLYAFALQRRQALLDGVEVERAQQAAVEQAAAREAELAAARESELAAALAREEAATKEREALQAAIDQLREQNTAARAAAAAAGAALPAVSVTATAPATVNQAARELQTLLKGRGCYFGSIDGIWGRGSTAALAGFLKETGVTRNAPRDPLLPDMVQYISAINETPGTNCAARPAPRKSAKTEPKAKSESFGVIPAQQAISQAALKAEQEVARNGKVETEAEIRRRAIAYFGNAPSGDGISQAEKCVQRWKKGGSQKYKEACSVLYGK